MPQDEPEHQNLKGAGNMDPDASEAHLDLQIEGLRTENSYTFEITLPRSGVLTPEHLAEMGRRLLQVLRSH